MPTLYRTDKTTVTAVECEHPEWPNVDADGKPIHMGSTHFGTEAAAWKELLEDVEYQMYRALDRVADLKNELHQTEQAALQRAAEFKAAKIQFTAWQEKTANENEVGE